MAGRLEPDGSGKQEMHIKEAVVTPVSELKPHPRNYRQHPSEQLDHIAESIRRNGVYRNVVVARDGTVLAGHGVLMAARRAGMTHLPVIRLDLDPDSPAALKVMAGDNEIGHMGVTDERLLADILREVGKVDEKGLLGTGFDAKALDDLIQSLDGGGGDGGAGGAGGSPAGDGKYTHKIVLPVYEPKNEKPAVKALVDTTKTDSLVSEIDAAGLPEEVAAFLRHAAQRHTVFNFKKIADFYAHSDEKVQDLFERSALVIIDFDKAVENGFVRLSSQIEELIAKEREEEAAAGGGDA